MNNVRNLVKWLIQETNKGNIDWKSRKHSSCCKTMVYECKQNEQSILVWGYAKNNYLQLNNHIVPDINVYTLIKAIENKLALDKENMFNVIASTALGKAKLEPEPPKEPSPWLRGRNVLGVGFVGSFALWTIFHNPGLCVIALGIGFAVCLIKSAIE